MSRFRVKTVIFMAICLSMALANISFAYDDALLLDNDNEAQSKIVENKDSNYGSSFEFDNYESEILKESKPNPLVLEDKYFQKNDKVTFASVVFNIGLMTFIFIGLLILIKMYLLKNVTDENYNYGNLNLDFLNVPEQAIKKDMPESNILSNLFDNPFQDSTNKNNLFSVEQNIQAGGGILNTKGLLLKQSLNLTPTQCVYVVEFEGKKLLLGSTQQGGVQLLSELNDEDETKLLEVKKDEQIISDGIINLLRKLVEKNENNENNLLDSSDKNLPDTIISNTISPSEYDMDNSQQIIIKDVKSGSSKKSLKKRSSYRESLTVYSVR